jgi:hypothetical protein
MKLPYSYFLFRFQRNDLLRGQLCLQEKVIRVGDGCFMSERMIRHFAISLSDVLFFASSVIQGEIQTRCFTLRPRMKFYIAYKYLQMDYVQSINLKCFQDPAYIHKCQCLLANCTWLVMWRRRRLEGPLFQAVERKLCPLVVFLFLEGTLEWPWCVKRTMNTVEIHACSNVCALMVASRVHHVCLIMGISKSSLNV